MEFFTEVLEWLKKCEKRFQRLDKNFRSVDLERVRESCMKQLQNVALQNYRDSIREVYSINWDRKNSVRLENLLNSVQVISEGKWGLKVFINENYIDFHDSLGEPVHKIITNYGVEKDNPDNLVRNIGEHWRTPIGNIPEGRYIIQEATRKIEIYVRTDFVSFVERELTKVLRGGK